MCCGLRCLGALLSQLKNVMKPQQMKMLPDAKCSKISANHIKIIFFNGFRLDHYNGTEIWYHSTYPGYNPYLCEKCNKFKWIRLVRSGHIRFG
jgi:hypothetical protein